MENIKGKVILVTGSTDGIGKQTALDLAGMGAEVFIHGRDEKKCKEVVNEIIESTKNENIKYLHADFSSLEDVKAITDNLKQTYTKLDVLINNAGTYKNKRELTKNEYEMTFAVNHLAPFLLTSELLPLLEKSDYARIVVVSSISHQQGDINFNDLMFENGYDAYKAYAQSKLANILFANKLAKNLEGTKITVNSLHPGVINTKLLHMGFDMRGDSVKNGAQTSVYLAASEEIKNVSGKYFVDMKPARVSEKAENMELQDKLWNASVELCKV